MMTADRVLVMVKARQQSADSMMTAYKKQQPGPSAVYMEDVGHWSEVAQRKHDAQQRIQAAKLREFIFLDMASQAVTMYVQQTGTKV